MKKIQFIISLFIITILLGCTNDSNDVNLDELAAPSSISALMTIKQDNSGKVTITPRGENVSQYEVYFGDGTTEPAIVNPGASVTHTYPENPVNEPFQVRIIGMTINGKTTEVIQPLEVSFLAPTDLVATIAHVTGDNMSITVTATANLETYFQVYFGDSPTEVPVDFMDGETKTHTYAATGTYQVRVVALSGGAATAEYIEPVIISNPILFPIDFESSSLNYAFTNFGGATSSVVNNPYSGAANGSTKVGKFTKMVGSEVWGGSFLELGTPINFSTMKKIKLKVWCPQAGKVIKMKLENLADNTINYEVNVTNTVANNWEELTFDFTNISTTNTYQRVVLFFDFGNAGTGANYYFDDIQQTTGLETLLLPINFQSATLPYTFTNFGSATSTVIANPQVSGINTSSKVASFLKASGAQTWAGSFLELASPLNFTVMQKIKMKVWSPAAGKVVKLKLEKLSDATINIEKDATTTVANGWEELTFNFAGINNANNYQRVVFFFDFGNAGNGATYYYDDITQSN